MIERVILSAGALLIFSVSLQNDRMPEGEGFMAIGYYIVSVVVNVAALRAVAGDQRARGLVARAGLGSVVAWQESR
jgi:hypothetical protein